MCVSRSEYVITVRAFDVSLDPRPFPRPGQSGPDPSAVGRRLKSSYCLTGPDQFSKVQVEFSSAQFGLRSAFSF